MNPIRLFAVALISSGLLPFTGVLPSLADQSLSRLLQQGLGHEDADLEVRPGQPGVVEANAPQENVLENRLEASLYEASVYEASVYEASVLNIQSLEANARELCAWEAELLNTNLLLKDDYLDHALRVANLQVSELPSGTDDDTEVELVPKATAGFPASENGAEDLRQLLQQGGVEDIPPGREEEDAEAAERKRLTAEHLATLRKPITDVKIEVTEPGRIPENRAALFTPPQRQQLISSVASGPPLPDRYTTGFMHRPLYYEQPNLERCGRSFRYLQNAVSGVQFVGRTIVLPYHICAEPCKCPVPAGGDCMTCQTYPLDCNPLPLNPPAFLTQAAAVAGFTFLLL